MTDPKYLNYDSYGEMGVREIQTISSETFFTCRAYNHYSSDNYYPFIKPLLWNYIDVEVLIVP